MEFLKYGAFIKEGNKIIHQGSFIYYTSAIHDNHEMASIVRNHFNEQTATVVMTNIQEISEADYNNYATALERR